MTLQSPYPGLVLAYLLTGLYITRSTRSRGLYADTLFTLFWIVYLFDDWRKGRL